MARMRLKDAKELVRLILLAELLSSTKFLRSRSADSTMARLMSHVLIELGCQEVNLIRHLEHTKSSLLCSTNPQASGPDLHREVKPVKMSAAFLKTRDAVIGSKSWNRTGAQMNTDRSALAVSSISNDTLPVTSQYMPKVKLRNYRRDAEAHRIGRGTWRQG